MRKNHDNLIIPYPTEKDTGSGLTHSHPLIIDFGELVYINTMQIQSSNLMELKNDNLKSSSPGDGDVNLDEMKFYFQDYSGVGMIDVNGKALAHGTDKKELCTESCQHPEYEGISDSDKIIGLGTQDMYSAANEVNPKGSCICYHKTGVRQETNIKQLEFYFGDLTDSNGTITETQVNGNDVLNSNAMVQEHIIRKVCKMVRIVPKTNQILNINDIKFTGFKYDSGSKYIFSSTPYDEYVLL